MNIQRPIIFVIFFFSLNTALAQDIIVKKDNEQIKAKVLEIGTDEIKYKPYGMTDGPTITINKDEIKSIKLEGQNQMVINVTEDPLDVNNNAILQKESSLKFHFFSPLRTHLAFSYEFVQKPGFNWEAGLGIIGPGAKITTLSDITKNPKGAFIRFGPKFLLGNNSDLQVKGGKYAHPLKGRYAKIEVILNTFSTYYYIDTTSYMNPWSPYQQPVYDYKVKESYQAFAINLIYGRQFILGNTITISYYAGIGYGFEDKTTNFPKNNTYSILGWDPRRYSHIMAENIPLTTTGGLTIGYIMHTPSWLKSKSVPDSGRRPSRRSMKE